MSIPMRICTSAEMKDLDQIAETEYLIDATLLMENAGRGAVNQLFEKYPSAGKEAEILVFAGKGNNAGDAFVVARRLLCLDRKVRIFYLADPSQYKGATLKNFEILQRMKAKMMQLERPSDLEAFFEGSRGPYLIVDGILGTGLKGNVEGLFFEVIELINRSTYDVVSLDIPSGVSGDTGATHGTAIQAALTISFGFPKLGHFLPPGAAKRGSLINVDISLPPRFRKEGNKFLLLSEPMARLLEQRDRYGHKNSFGHSLLIGGSPGRLGAITMAARACHKMGTGLVTVASWEDALQALLVKLPDETMAIPLKLEGPDFEKFIRNQLPQFSSIVAGPGLGRRPEGKVVLELILSRYQGPIVLDADALNLVAEHDLYDHIQKREAPTVLTPHPGEMGRLLKKTSEEVLASPLESVKEAVQKTHAVVILKGAATLMGSLDEQIFLNHYPNDGMATAGTGDVLAGMVGGFVGQGMDPFSAAKLGVYLHSLAGDFAAREFGHRSMTAPDIIANIGNAFKELKNQKEPAFPEEGRARLL